MYGMKKTSQKFVTDVNTLNYFFIFFSSLSHFYARSQMKVSKMSLLPSPYLSVCLFVYNNSRTAGLILTKFYTEFYTKIYRRFPLLFEIYEQQQQASHVET